MAFHFDITDFRLFVNIAEASSLTRGAERSFISVPAASNRIKNLEENIGVKLLERSPTGVTITEAGRTYLQHARSVLSQLELLTGDLQAYTEGLKSQLRLLANTTAVTEYLPAVLSAFLRTHPDVHVEMRERISDEIVRQIREGAADLGVISGDVGTEGIQSVPFVSSQLIIIAPIGHAVLDHPRISFREALDHAFVSLLEGSASSVFYSRAAAALHKPMSIRVQVAGSDAIFRMVEAGAGIAIVPLACFERLRTGAIGSCLLSDSWATRTFRLCARDFEQLSSPAQSFAHSLVTHYAGADAFANAI
ncbi:LysR family transcriptional regulator [Pseudomonas sp. S31]|uniref:LysR substrate-binding domain-containing protein n=1 Tax=Pseudomonas sp. S31 TaxID=1564473 RepID=UPI0019130163|nr:LysR substrate-binding domain-containing protein [Pseudomonas sp. S31]MBK5002428.1 LysR family transcriptional regulator [Pseudomonas sp. S31]